MATAAPIPDEPKNGGGAAPSADKPSAQSAATKDEIKRWMKRWAAAEKVKETWESENRVADCYDFWRGRQLAEPIDTNGDRRAQVNKIHPAVAGQIPSLYFYRPYARVSAAAEKTDTPGTSVDAGAQLLQDTANFFARDPDVGLRLNTFLALKESFWAMGIVEVGYSANWDDTAIGRPPLKEDDKVRDADGLPVGEGSDYASLSKEYNRLKGGLKSESFYVKHIPTKQFFCSHSDKPNLKNNDWVGYWEDYPLEDVKRNPAYDASGLKESADTERDTIADKTERDYDEGSGSPVRIRLYKIWDLRTKTRYVIARNHDKYLLTEPFERCPLKFHRFDIDPYHFYPRPPILDWLGPQEEYNHSREYLRVVRNNTRPRWTYDEGSVDEEQVRKFASNDYSIAIPRHAGTPDPFIPVQQPTLSEGAVRTLTLSEKELADTGGVGGDPRLPQTRTATQAKIAEVKEQALDSFERATVADWLAEILEELVLLALEHMNLTKWIAVNVAPDSPYAQDEALAVAQQYQAINASRLSSAVSGIGWHLSVDVDTLSPVSEDQKFQRWMQMLGMFANPALSMLFSVSPEMLRETLNLSGMKSARQQQLIGEAVQRVVQMQMQMASMGQNASKGVSPAGGSGAGPAPTPQNAAPREGGGPQPGGPAGPNTPQPK